MFTHRKVCSTSGFAFRFVRIVDERHFLSIENKPSFGPTMECGTEFMKISKVIIEEIIYFLLVQPYIFLQRSVFQKVKEKAVKNLFFFTNKNIIRMSCERSVKK